MYCKVCGEKCPEGAEFCTKCGQKLNETVYQTPVVEEVEEKKGGKGLGIASMILGICSVVCCWSGLSTPAAIAGLIMGIISNKQSKKGTATIGTILSIVGLIISLLIVLAAIIYVVVICVIYGVSIYTLFSDFNAYTSPGYYY